MVGTVVAGDDVVDVVGVVVDATVVLEDDDVVGTDVVLDVETATGVDGATVVATTTVVADAVVAVAIVDAVVDCDVVEVGVVEVGVVEVGVPVAATITRSSATENPPLRVLLARIDRKERPFTSHTNVARWAKAVAPRVHKTVRGPDVFAESPPEIAKYWRAEA